MLVNDVYFDSKMTLIGVFCLFCFVLFFVNFCFFFFLFSLLICLGTCRSNYNLCSRGEPIMGICSWYKLFSGHAVGVSQLVTRCCLGPCFRSHLVLLCLNHVKKVCKGPNYTPYDQVIYWTSIQLYQFWPFQFVVKSEIHSFPQGCLRLVTHL